MSEGPEPFLFVILGGTGDLSLAKIMPAIRRLAGDDLLGRSYRILGVSRNHEMDDRSFRALIADALAKAGFAAADDSQWCEQRLLYQPVSENSREEYQALRRRIEEIEKEADLPGNRVFYLSTPPAAFEGAIVGLGETGLNAQEKGWTRLVIEKPFGRDLDSSRALNALVHRYFDENQIYRIDHYLGKETVQNLLVLRFANTILESVWNRDRVDNVQITVAESGGIGTRAAFYDKTGALRDVVQNHVTQLVSLIAMETPVDFTAESIAQEKIKLVKAIRPLGINDVVFGQYVDGEVHNRKVAGYRKESKVPQTSTTETYVAIRLAIDNWRWQGVPFFVRTGKRMPERRTEIAVTFKTPPVHLLAGLGASATKPNVLLLTLQPDEGFALLLDIQAPTEPISLRTIPLDFRYRQAFNALPDAYQTLLLDILTGDRTLFVQAEEVERSWKLYTPILQMPKTPFPYRAGTWGPVEADALLARTGHIWRNPGTTSIP